MSEVINVNYRGLTGSHLSGQLYIRLIMSFSWSGVVASAYCVFITSHLLNIQISLDSIGSPKLCVQT